MSRFKYFVLPGLCLGLLMAVNGRLSAQQQAGPTEQQQAGPNAQDQAGPAGAASDEGTDIESLIRQLDADRFAERQTATNQLARRGAEAIPALEKAALGSSREVTTRCVEILSRHFDTGGADAKDAARKSLERISTSDHPVAKRLAEKALSPEPENPPPAPRAVPVPAQIQIRMQAIGGRNVQRIQVRNNNGVKEMEVQENDRKVKIVDDPANGIKVEVTEKKDGKETTQKYSAKNADELKKKHPEAHKIYEKYQGQQGGVQIRGIQIGGVPIQIQQRAQIPQRGPMPRRALPVGPAQRLEPRSKIAERLDEVQKRLDEATRRIKELSEKPGSEKPGSEKDGSEKDGSEKDGSEKDGGADTEALRKSLRELEEASQQLKEARQRLMPTRGN